MGIFPKVFTRLGFQSYRSSTICSDTLEQRRIR
jgi:hypothetical protein